MADASWTLTAHWVFPVAGPPLQHGTVTIQGERIEAVNPKGERTADYDLGNAAIIPGLVNAHTHLDLSGLRGRCRPVPDFTAWLRQVIHHRRGQTPEQVTADVQQGLAESLRFGTTLVGDVSAGGLSWPVLAAAPIRAVVFFELLGLTEARAAQALSQARDWLVAHENTATCWVGLSPHAPYSVRVSLFAEVAALRFPRRGRPPIAAHVAETREELELLASRRGPFVDFLAELGAWDPDGLVRDVRQVLRMMKTAPGRSLFVHGNYLKPMVLRSALAGGASLVYCPRTHAAFGHPRHPFRKLLSRGRCLLALGTDSLASNPDLDVLAEARFVRGSYPKFPTHEILRMATLGGAESLGWGSVTGSLSPGKSADLVVLGLADEEPQDPHDLFLKLPISSRATLFRGQWLISPHGIS
jgi:cytosine/adenosine deaminase-related metal-dependent hydrolase